MQRNIEQKKKQRKHIQFLLFTYTNLYPKIATEKLASNDLKSLLGMILLGLHMPVYYYICIGYLFQ